MKHTPGPWTVERTDSDPGIPRSSGGGAKIRVVAGQNRICSAARLGDSLRQSEANARLIAAAPDLLAALLKVQPFIESHALEGEAGNSVAEEMRDEIRAAIAKASMFRAMVQ